jgi:hypothetical protein
MPQDKDGSRDLREIWLALAEEEKAQEDRLRRVSASKTLIGGRPESEPHISRFISHVL